MHQQVLALVVIAGNQGLTLGDQVQNLHALKPAVAQRCCHHTLQRHSVGKGRADAQQCQHVTVLQGLRQPLRIQHDFLHLARRIACGSDAFQQGFLRGCQGRHTAAERQDIGNATCAGLEFVDGGLIKSAGNSHTRADRRNDDDVA